MEWIIRDREELAIIRRIAIDFYYSSNIVDVNARDSEGSIMCPAIAPETRKTIGNAIFQRLSADKLNESLSLFNRITNVIMEFFYRLKFYIGIDHEQLAKLVHSKASVQPPGPALFRDNGSLHELGLVMSAIQFSVQIHWQEFVCSVACYSETVFVSLEHCSSRKKESARCMDINLFDNVTEQGCLYIVECLESGLRTSLKCAFDDITPSKSRNEQ